MPATTKKAKTPKKKAPRTKMKATKAMMPFYRQKEDCWYPEEIQGCSEGQITQGWSRVEGKGCQARDDHQGLEEIWCTTNNLGDWSIYYIRI